MSDKKKIFKGDLVAEPGVVYEYEEITGHLYADGMAAGAFPKATSLTVGGDLYARGMAAGAFPKATSLTVGGHLYADGMAAGAFPKACKIDANNPAAIAKARKSIFHANLKLGYYYVDGILARLVNRKGKVARVVICGKTAMSYVVEDANGNYSHGATLAEARSGLMFKLSSRDTSTFKKWTHETKVSLPEAITAYRAITGACEQGTRHFCEGVGKLPDNLTIGEAIKMTAGQYGNRQFAEFFNVTSPSK